MPVRIAITDSAASAVACPEPRYERDADIEVVAVNDLVEPRYDNESGYSSRPVDLAQRVMVPVAQVSPAKSSPPSAMGSTC